MAARIIRVDQTPNPNAFKCIVDPPPGTIRSFFNREAAKDDPLAHAIFSVDGVTNVLVHEAFITISKAPDTPWPKVRKQVERALSALSDASE